MKFGICNEMYVGEPISKVIESVSKLGFNGIELAPFTLADDIEAMPVRAQREIAACAATNGIEILGLHWLLAGPKGLHVTTSDASIRARTKEYFRKLIEIAVNTGGKVLTLGSPAQRSFGDGETPSEAQARFVGFLRELAPELESAGASLSLEPLEPEMTNFMTRTSEARMLADRIDSSAVGITLDTHFMRWEIARHGGSFLDTFRAAGPRLTHMHIQDDNLLAPGTGGADFSQYVRAVRDISWPGYISFEAFEVKGPGRGQTLAGECMEFFGKHFPEQTAL